MRRSSLLSGSLTLTLTALTACSSKDAGSANDAPDTADAAPATSATFTPKGCGFTVGAIDGFPEFEAHAEVIGKPVNDGKNDYGPKPAHVRVGLGGDVDAGKSGYADPSKSFAVVWQTDAETLASKMRIAGSAETVASAEPIVGFSYLLTRESSVSGGPEEGVRFHETYACGLEPGRTYYYQVGGGPAGQEVWSDVRSYTTAPAKGGTEPVLLGFAGDSRDELGRTDLPVWKAIGNRVKVAGAHMMTFSGDFVLVGTSQDMWETWNKAADGFGSELFVAMAPGNHENEQLRYFANALMPGKVGKNAERYASFDYGPVHVVMLDDFDGIIYEAGDSTGYKTELLAWLEKDLAAADANRSNVPFVMTFHHHPLFTSGTKTERVKERAAVRAALQSMFDAHHVDIDVAGHDHFYERSKPIVADAEDAKGTRYIVCAAGGAPSYDTATTPLSQTIVHYDPDVREGIYGLVTATKTTFAVKVYKMNGATGTSPADDAVVDEYTISR
jgi:hypothetical protein